MSEWRDTTLGELLSVKHGWAFKGEFFASEGDEIVLTPGNFPIGGGLHFREGKERFYTGPYPREFRLSPGDLLIVMTDLKQDAPILGSPAFVPTQPTVLHNQRLGLVQVRDGVDLDVGFLYYLLLSEESRRQLRATATGSTVRHTAPSRIYQVKARIPPLVDQSRIGGVLQAIDNLIENNRRRAEVLEEMARAIYREWFVCFRYPGHEDVTLVDSPLGPIPDGWAWSRFSEVAWFVNGFAFKPGHWGSSGRPIIKIKELKQGVTASTPRCEEALVDKKYWIDPGDLLFSWSADLGVYRWSGEPGLLNQHLFVVTPSADLSIAFLQHALDAAMSQFWNRAQGTTMRHIKRSALSEVLTVVPPVPAVAAFTDAVEPLAQEALTLQESARNLTSLRDLLLPRLVTGKVHLANIDGFTEAAIA